MTVQFDAIRPVPGPLERARAQAVQQGRRSRQQKAADTRRQHLLEVAWALFSEVGVGAFNMRDLGARAGYSAGALYSYFPGRSQVMVELRHRLLALLKDRVGRAARQSRKSTADNGQQASDKPRNAFERCTLAWWQVLSSDRNALALLLSGQMAPNAPHLSDGAGSAERGADVLNALSDATQACALALESAGMAGPDALEFHRRVLCLGIGMLVMQPASMDSMGTRQVATQRFLEAMRSWCLIAAGEDNRGSHAPAEVVKAQVDLFGR